MKLDEKLDIIPHRIAYGFDYPASYLKLFSRELAAAWAKWIEF